jgi:threonine dehydrogenase-like Zn-dependent dehydrogenase
MTPVPARMRQVQKGEGFGNMRLGEAETPVPGPRQVLVRNRRSLISRGSEIGRRYRLETEVDPGIIGYSSAGDVVAVGNDVDPAMIGSRLSVVAPHAEYVIGDLDSIVVGAVTHIPDDVSYEQAAFCGLAGAGIIWTEISNPRPGEDVVVMGLGLVGNLVMQAVRQHNPARIIAIDAIDGRCALASELGADQTVNVREVDPVERVKELTGGQGAHLVMECVGGPAGVKSFPQAVSMTRKLGRIHLISLYQEQPLPLDSGAIQQRMLIGGYFIDLEASKTSYRDEAMRRIATGEVNVDRLMSHTVRPEEAKAAFDLLHDRLAEAMGVIFDWDA